MSHQLFQGDCLDVMRGIPSESVDLVVTDPPYEVTITAVSLPRPYTDRLKLSGWNFNHAWIPHVARILRRGGAWYVFMNDEGWSSLKVEAKEYGLYPAGRLVWIKTNPRPVIPNKVYRSGTELIMYGTKGRSPAYFAERTQQELLPYFVHPVVGGRVRTAHPTQKPLNPIQTWVETSCPPDGVVLDPFMGSGTTGVACVNTGRQFIGIEKDAGYFQIARERIDKAQGVYRQVKLDLTAKQQEVVTSD